MVLQILSKISDLKTLCICELVSKRFYRTVLQVESISFTSVIDPIVIPPNMKLDVSVSFTLLMPFESAILSLKKFKRVKSLNIQLLSSFNNPLLFKWTIKFDNKLNSFVFFSTDYVYKDLYPKTERDCMELRDTKYKTVSRYFVDAWISHCMLLQCCIENLPLLENISITDLGKKRTISYSRERIIAMRNILTLPYEKFKHKLLIPEHWDEYYTSFLELPISGYVMDGVTFTVRARDDLHNNLCLLSTDILDDDLVGDKEEAAYNEAIKKMSELLEKFRAWM
ncbi:F-box domain, Leucine-rich repeat domain, L domain-like protein [Artemisia annua]|uniref:F-box domain, Leucine-rich repeat domain, L domain-like protein n=1 Tax=Artemisia annua TaxID=35608 RepID=A0A2U1NTE7_ARTAN|nr:F-box domain, Leucine-rich repeat domain, L domain-like protein [Artemisia annua]